MVRSFLFVYSFAEQDDEIPGKQCDSTKIHSCVCV
jgi:hypothetical protein